MIDHKNKTKEELLLLFQELEQENISLKSLYQKETTVHMQVEKELRLSEEKYRLLAELSPEMIYLIDQKGNILYINSVAAAPLHLDAYKVIGMHLTEIFPPAIAQEHLVKINKVFETKQNFQEEIEETFPSGKIWIDVRLSPLINGHGNVIAVLGLSNDITARKRAEEKSRKLSKAVEQSPASIVITDINGDIEYVNPKFVEITGYTYQEAIGKNPRILKSGFTTDEEYLNLWRIISSGGTWEGEFRNKKKNGEFYWESSKISPIMNDSGIISNYVAVKEDITGRKQIEEALSKSEMRFKTMFSDAPLGIAMIDSVTGKINEMNQMFAKIAGGTVSEMADIDWISITHPDDIQLDLDNMALLVKGEINGFQMEKRYIRPDGSIVWINMTISHLIKEENMPLRHLCMIEDITERKESAELIEMLKKSIDVIPEGAYWMDIDLNFVYINEAGSKSLGYSNEELIGKSVMKVNPSVTPDGIVKLRELLISKGISKDETIHRRKDGSEFPVEISTTYVKYENKEIFCGIAIDITERKKAEKEIILKNEELGKINAEKDKFFSILAHDLRSPFNGFLGLTDIIATELHGMTLDEIQEIALMLNKSATNLYTLLGNLLEWSRIQRGLISVNPESFLLLPKISDSLKLIIESAQNKEIKLNFDIPEDFKVFTDANILEVIIRNLTNNAVKFTPKGGSINVAAKSTTDNFVQISIKDTGIGMNKQMIDDLFKLNVDTRRTGTGGEASTGLGLIICKDLIEIIGGRLWIESQEGKGCEFHFAISN